MTQDLVATRADAQVDPAGDGAWSARAREVLVEAEARLDRRFGQTENPEKLIALRARAVDQLLRNAWVQCIANDSGLSLFAVGGYGRGELFPRSDIDVLVLGEPAAQAAHAEAIARLFAMLWDAGLAVSHAVRSLAQCAEAAAAEQTVMTALIEARPVVADSATRKALAGAIAPEVMWPAREFFQAKRAELQARHKRFGDTADNLEPDIKDGPGGLRDLHTLGWMSLRAFGVRDIEALVGLGHVGLDEAAALKRERIVLSRLRYGLHLVARRGEERLRFDHQKALAARLGYADDDGSLAVEKMMQGFYRSAAVIRRVSDRMLQRFEEQFDGSGEPLPVQAGFSLRNGYLNADDPAWPYGRMGDLFDLFAAWAVTPQARGLHSLTARAVAEYLDEMVPYTAVDQTTRDKFMRLMRAGDGAQTLARMGRLGVLGQWIPAFAQVSGRMQFDLFHAYTVDQHTLMVLRNIGQFAAGAADERFSIAHQVWPRLSQPELLLLAGLFHDIAKGRGGDHSELGAVDARAFCQAHGLDAHDTDLVAWLVEQHLRMSVTAQKQDITDPDVVHGFARLVGSRERLDYLYLLTCADIAGTSPKLWNAWKDRLLADLYFATRRALREGLEPPLPETARVAAARREVGAWLHEGGYSADQVAGLLARMPDEAFVRFRIEQLMWQAQALAEVGQGELLVRARPIQHGANALELLVHSPDRDGLFAAIVISLDRLGFAIHRARILDGPDDTVLDTFEVSPADSFADPDPQALVASLQRVLSAPLEGLRPVRRVVPRQLRHFRFAPRIDFPEAGESQCTLLNLVAPDRPGLLADVAEVVRDQNLRVHDARIATFGERGEDQFLLTDHQDRPLDETARQALREALQAALAPR
ncbi:protein-PII uridylyltransferase [Stenotrophomonas ginsengisoli]|uniref:Bifunctional uridylyltransferase/uridylyl-removing enzyme n=1 Tax=Stenotrophomonas ginsengisoli TaxID=336566 RepID=A0A0R0D6V0_9GAMM|nr:[protein-PII] uridylyltransferase [Stenotrophomonas ginsengisoli]KRG77387.1 protein-PII uridylyltransferase [Stenotrophomonas ginsengisoli]